MLRMKLFNALIYTGLFCGHLIKMNVPDSDICHINESDIKEYCKCIHNDQNVLCQKIKPHMLSKISQVFILRKALYKTFVFWGGRIDDLGPDALMGLDMDTLIFDNAVIVTIAPDAFEHCCTHLKKLVFTNSLPDIPIDFVFPIKSLDMLILNHNRLVSLRGSSRIQNQRSNLTVLDVRDNSLETIGLDILTTFTSLYTLKLSGNPWECACRPGMNPRKNVLHWLASVINTKKFTEAEKADFSTAICKSLDCGDRFAPFFSNTLDVCPNTIYMNLFNRHSYLYAYINFSILLALMALKTAYSIYKSYGLNISNSKRYFDNIEKEYSIAFSCGPVTTQADSTNS